MVNDHHSRTMLLALSGVLAIGLIGWVGFVAALPERQDVETVAEVVNNDTEDKPDVELDSRAVDDEREVAESHEGEPSVRGTVTAVENGRLALTTALTASTKARELTILVTAETAVTLTKTAVKRGPGSAAPEPTASSMEALTVGSTVVVYSQEAISDSATEITAIAIEQLQ